MYLLDTNTLIYLFKNQGNVAQNLKAIPTHSLYISSITLFELYTGIAKSQSPEKRTLQLQHLLAQITLLNFDEKSAEIAANIRADLEIKGIPIGTLDILIASVALANDLTVVTHNTKEFLRVKNLQVIDWF